MSPTQSRRINPTLLQADMDAQVTLAAMADYRPVNETFTLAKVAEALTTLQEARQSELLAQSALNAARDAAVAAEWCFHEIMLGVKEQVVAQYGKSSDQLQSLGLKKKSEYKRPVRAAKSA